MPEPLERMMAKRGWSVVTNDLLLLLFGIQDAALMAENVILAAESFGLDSCFLGITPYNAENIIKEYGLPKRVFPLVELVMGYLAKNPTPRLRYPLEYILFDGKYPDLGDEQVEGAMAVMDEGYLEQDYYRNSNYIIPLEGDREETYTYNNYGWSEHISPKWGQRYPVQEEMIAKMKVCGFEVYGGMEGEKKGLGVRESQHQKE